MKKYTAQNIYDDDVCVMARREVYLAAAVDARIAELREKHEAQIREVTALVGSRDARITELEKALTRISECYLCCGSTNGCQGRKVHEIAGQALGIK